MKNVSLIILVSLLTACAGGNLENKPDLKTNKSNSIGMVVTANPLASKAGADVLLAGGSAVDAAIAIEAVLSLVEPQSSGLGGGGFLVHFDNQTNSLSVYDGRESAPKNIQADQFLDQDGKSIGFINAKNSGLSTGVPGMVAMLQLAHQDHGNLPWGVHFDRAKSLATDGFAISPRLAGMIERFGKYIPKTTDEGPTDAYQYFYNAGKPRAAGEILKNPAYAETLETIRSDPTAFYQGEIAQQIVAQTSLAPRAGSLSLTDMAAYKAHKTQAICAPYQDSQVCGPQPASSWIAVGEILGLLEHAPAFSSQGANDSNNWNIFAEAQRLAYADRDHFIADNEFVAVPLEGILNQEYLKQRASAISNKAAPTIEHGDPWAFQSGSEVALGKDATNDVAGTTHFVVVDSEGDVVSLTASVESIFGSTRMAGGMFLNNQLTDFSFKVADDQGLPIANRIEPGKRPRSSMSPTIVLDSDGEFLMATGSPGGNSIIAYTAKTLVGVLAWGLSPQEAIDLPNLVARGDKVRIERDRASSELIEGLREFGFEVNESSGENSGLSVVLRKADGSLEGGVDPRREGVIETVSF